MGFTESLQQRYTSSGVVRRSLRSAPAKVPYTFGLVLVSSSWSGLVVLVEVGQRRLGLVEVGQRRLGLVWSHAALRARALMGV